jgi:hypothetical protein
MKKFSCLGVLILLSCVHLQAQIPGKFKGAALQAEFRGSGNKSLTVFGSVVQTSHIDQTNKTHESKLFRR